MRRRRILLFPVTRILIWIAVTILLAFLLRWLALPALERAGVPEAARLLDALAAGLGLALLIWVIERRGLGDAGLGPRGLLRDTALGFALGGIILAGTVGAMALAGFYRAESVAGEAVWPVLAAGLWYYLWVSVFEEVALRGVFFRLMEEWLGSWWALAVSALLFGLLHLPNDNSSLFAALCVAVEAGILLGAAFMLTRNLWLAIGIHWGWGVFEGPVFGTPVSGFQPAEAIVTPVIEGPPLLTGGAFGPEASLFCLIVATAAGLLLLRRAAGRGQVRRARRFA